MNRRSFSRVAAFGASTTALGGTAAAQRQTKQAGADQAPNGDFALKFAPHAGHFSASAGDDILAQIEFAREQGFTAWEDNGLMHRPEQLQQQIGDKLAELGMTMGVFVTYAEFDSSKWVEKADGFEQELRDTCKRAVDCAGRCGARWSTIVPGLSNESIRDGYAFWNVVELLRVVAEEFEPAGLSAVLEPLNPIDHPRCWLKSISQAYALCKTVNSPSVKILDDFYHQQITEGDLIRNFDRARSEIPYLQVGDNPGRQEPGSGEINYKRIFRHLKDNGFDGVVGMEHSNSQGNSIEGEQHLIQVYRAMNPQ